MSIEQDILETTRHLPPERQMEVRDFAGLLRLRQPAVGPCRSVVGSARDLGMEITEDDIAEA